MTIKTLLVFVSALAMASADKDSDYYYPGLTNPNVNTKMYWKDAINVLQDLDQFASLHIKYHGCVYVLFICCLPVPVYLVSHAHCYYRWSKYGARYGSGEYYDFEDQDDDVGQSHESSNGCGGDGGEYFWYLGRSQCFRANVAYSLYGILKGESSRSDACRKSTYINSFFTNYGVESFGGPLGLDVDTANSYCKTSTSGASEYYNADDVSQDDDYLNDDVQFVNYAAYTSYGTGCVSGKFVTDKYSGAFCNGDSYMSTTSTLDTFNEAIESLGCTQIYSNNQGRELEDQNNQDYNFGEMDAVTILSFSTACDIRQYPRDCPDPYGKKRQYTKNLERALTSKTGSMRNAPQKTATAFTWIFNIAGVVLLGLAYNVHRKTARKPHPEDSTTTRSIEKEPESFAAIDQSESFQSTGSDHNFWNKRAHSVGHAARTIKESIRSFAEAEEAEVVRQGQVAASPERAVREISIHPPYAGVEVGTQGPVGDSPERVAPGTNIHPSYAEVEDGPTVAASLERVIHETNTLPAPNESSTSPEVVPEKKKKRPRLAALSLKLFGKKR